MYPVKTKRFVIMFDNHSSRFYALCAGSFSEVHFVTTCLKYECSWSRMPHSRWGPLTRRRTGSWNGREPHKFLLGVITNRATENCHLPLDLISTYFKTLTWNNWSYTETVFRALKSSDLSIGTNLPLSRKPLKYRRPKQRTGRNEEC